MAFMLSAFVEINGPLPLLSQPLSFAHHSLLPHYLSPLLLHYLLLQGTYLYSAWDKFH